MLNTHQQYGVTSRHIRCSSWDKRSTPYLVCIARFFFYSVCIELNAHALLTFLLTIRDHFDGNTAFFAPWLLGSQSCEKIFRSARSMTNTFSTVINFSMLGLLRRLHRLQIQSNLQAQSEATGIVYPQINKHKFKDGKNMSFSYAVSDVSDKIIGEAIAQASSAAKASIESLGMDDLLKKKQSVWPSFIFHYRYFV